MLERDRMSRDLMLTPTEYSALLRLIDSERESEGSTVALVDADVPKKKRKVSMYQKEFGRQMKRLKKQHTLKNGSLRRGWNSKRLMNAAHAAAKRARR